LKLLRFVRRGIYEVYLIYGEGEVYNLKPRPLGRGWLRLISLVRKYFGARDDRLLGEF